MTDNDLMPFGKYQGQKMANVPAEYLMYIYDKGWVSIHKFNKVFWYIKDNLRVLQVEVRRKKAQEQDG